MKYLQVIGNNSLDFWDRINLAMEREELQQEGLTRRRC